MKDKIRTAGKGQYLMLNSYRSAVADFSEFGVKKGWYCTNCRSQVYLDKCANDECYNFQVFTSYRYNLYEEYWSQVSKLPVKNTDPLPDIRPMIEKALVEAFTAARDEERAWLAYQLRMLRPDADEAELNILNKIAAALRERANQGGE